MGGDAGFEVPKVPKLTFRVILTVGCQEEGRVSSSRWVGDWAEGELIGAVLFGDICFTTGE